MTQDLKKQILYPRFITRLFAFNLDLLIIMIITRPLTNLINQFLIKIYFFDEINVFNTKYGAFNSSLKYLSSYEFISSLTLGKTLLYCLTSYSLLFFLTGCYFVSLWHFNHGATIGKIFTKTKVVNNTDFSQPQLSQLIKRYLGYITILVGIWPAIFSKQGIALHDKLSSTLVVKS